MKRESCVLIGKKKSKNKKKIRLSLLRVFFLSSSPLTIKKREELNFEIATKTSRDQYTKVNNNNTILTFDI